MPILTDRNAETLLLRHGTADTFWSVEMTR
jgi:hypothetical protein